MKQSLLLIALLTGIYGGAQLTTANQFNIGDSRAYYSLDSNATNLSTILGTGVTWDYSLITGYFGSTTNTNNVLDASTAMFASDYPTTALAEEFQNGVHTYFNNVGSDVIVDGFVYQEGGSDIVVQYDIDDLLALSLPMNVTDTYTDPIAGDATASIGTVDLTGTANITCDGSGTLIIGIYTYPNVIRIHTLEVSSGDFAGETIVVTRESYVYYDLDDANPLPIFRHDRVEVDLGAFGNLGFQAVYSKDDVTNYVNLDDTTTNSLSIYPNPARDILTISFEGTTAHLTVMNAAGQIVYTNTSFQNIESINISDFEAGIYLVQIKTDKGITTEKVTVK